MEIKTAIKYLNHPIREIRFECVKVLSDALKKGRLPCIERINGQNNQVRSQYSFSPYSPSMVAWKAYQAGVSTCGFMDYESVEGCREFWDACRLFGIVPTLGFEMRMNWRETETKKGLYFDLENESVCRFAIHGISISKLLEYEKFLYRIRQERWLRNIKMTDRIHKILSIYGMYLDFEQDIVPFSKWIARGNITEKHLLYAAAKKIREKYKTGTEILSFLCRGIGADLSNLERKKVLNEENPFYLYDITDILEKSLLKHIYEPVSMYEVPSAKKMIPYLIKRGGIPSYIFEGEKNVLHEMIDSLVKHGMQTISYVPHCGDVSYMWIVQTLCQKYSLIGIAENIIDHPQQLFCEIEHDQKVRVDMDKIIWAIVGHENVVNVDVSQGLFSYEICRKYPCLKERLDLFEKIGRASTKKWG